MGIGKVVPEPDTNSNQILPFREVLYCGACGMPLEYCEYGPDYETHCNPWLKKHHPTLYQELGRGATGKRNNKAASSSSSSQPSGGRRRDSSGGADRPERPWTTEERLTAFYQKYVPEKVDGIPALLVKYQGKEEKLFLALTQKYGEEPEDPYYAEDEDDDDDDDNNDDGENDRGFDKDENDNNDNDGENKGDDEDDTGAPSEAERRKRRGAAAKPGSGGDAPVIRVVVQKVAQKKKRNLTVIFGLETAGLKLKDASKAFSRRFAGSSSVKKTLDGKGEEIIIQGDHVYDVAEMIVDKFHVPDSAVFIDVGEGTLVPLRWEKHPTNKKCYKSLAIVTVTSIL